jgi:Lrp/AsnC family leucine-responsive transcriptional regulator
MIKNKYKSRSNDLMIVSRLRRDSRATLTEMSRETRIPVSTIFDKMKDYKRSGLIKKNTSIVSFERLGYGTKALIFFSTQKEEREKLSELLQKSRSVNSLFRVNDGWDLVAEVIFPNLNEIENFVENIDAQVSVRDKKVFYILEEFKREEFMSDPDYITLTNQ